MQPGLPVAFGDGDWAQGVRGAGCGLWHRAEECGHSNSGADRECGGGGHSATTLLKFTLLVTEWRRMISNTQNDCASL